MKKTVIAVGCLMLLSLAAVGQKTLLHTNKKTVDFILDGKKQPGVWTVMPEANPDLLETTAKEVVFASDTDTLTVNNLQEWETFDFVILTNEGDSAHVRVKRIPENPFDNPDPELLKIASSGLLSKQQAAFDIDALLYGISQVHPDIFSVSKQVDILRAVNNAKYSLPDSVSLTQLYQAAAPIVAMVGDGHTSLSFPAKRVFTSDLKRLPLSVNVYPDHSIICNSSLDSIIPNGDRILSINGVSADSIINTMLPYVSGEREHFKISRINSTFRYLFHMLFAAENYKVEYQKPGSKKVLTHNFPALTATEIKDRLPSVTKKSKTADYSYTIDSVNDVAIMDFRRFNNQKKMEQFADSMFSDLKKRNISNLIIDIRENGGGQSLVGDILLRYISNEPFLQMDKAFVKITPLTAKLIDEGGITPMIYFHEAKPSDFIKPRKPEEGHYNGNVFLLTSNNTFSSASSFAWAFKECDMGKVIGEETGGMNVCYGDILPYELPISKLKCYISFKRFWQLRADENDIHGTLPDIAVPSAVALEEAMKQIKKKSK